MQRTRPITTQRCYGMGFVAAVLGVILCIHLCFVCIIWLPKLWRLDAVFVLLVHHLLFAGLLSTFYQCIMTDPGVVPPNWGFYMGDETKRRRYCKMCNVWKPDRTHHCSICNRCILNMDHHCPWINNCVGFYNRKFFIQLLLYAYSILLNIAMTSFFSWDLCERVATLIKGGWGKLLTFYGARCLGAFFAFGFSVLLIFMLHHFLKFHLKLVLENYTTIENLEREEGAKSKFDIGRRRNWEQVFGTNPWFWWYPAHTAASRPVGDGVRWRVHYTRVIDEDEELPAEG